MIEEVIKKFNLKGKITNIKINSSGNIHTTYIVTLKDENNSQKYLIQKINTVAFNNPYELMENISNVTKYIQKQLDAEEDTLHKTMEILETEDGYGYTVITNKGEREYYRVYKFIDGCVSFDATKDEKIIYNVAKAFGNFQKLLRDYPINNLHETIKNFHNTKVRYDTFMKDYKKCKSKRKRLVKKEVEFIKERKDICQTIVDVLGTSEVPLRVTHNDTKVNNVLLDFKTLEFKAVIDLDTVMPGSMLFDYGDGVRSIASNTLEDEKDLTKVSLNLDFFKAYTDGYLSEVAPYITTKELSLMAQSIRIITLELAIRFLDDYLNGDVYFKIDYKEHNLDRARCQLALVNDIENKLEEMDKYISQCYEKYVKINV